MLTLILMLTLMTVVQTSNERGTGHTLITTCIYAQMRGCVDGEMHADMLPGKQHDANTNPGSRNAGTSLFPAICPGKFTPQIIIDIY